ncbi:MAG: RNA-binding S4 domain-containing protein [Acholeplasmataceae bacterium]|nr:RNA-binding S4 domain-containing protein [Acholeplasmataceae bacterium]
MKIFKSQRPEILLGQFLKATGLIGSGGEAKLFLSERTVMINRIVRTERGAKLHHGDIVSVEGDEWMIRHDT